jgi:hypothetical protein
MTAVGPMRLKLARRKPMLDNPMMRTSQSRRHATTV